MKKYLTESADKWIFLLLLFLFCLRMIGLDKDMPGLTVAQYMPSDEGYYAMQAFQLVNPEEVEAVQRIDTGNWQQWNSAVSFLTTLFCTLTLTIFGDNYYGLRMAAVLAGFFVYLFMLLFLYQEEKKRGKQAQTALLYFGGIGVCSFAFLLASRIVEPSIFRMLATMCMVWIFYRQQKKGGDGYFGMGVFAVLSVVWGYATNLFVFVPCGMLLLAELCWEKSAFWKKTGRFLGGCTVAYVLGEGIMYLVQRRFFWQDFLRVVVSRESSRASFSPVMIKDNTIAYFSGNLYIYGGAMLLVLAVFCVVYNLISGWLVRDRIRLLLGFLVAGHTVQSMLTNDFAWRKSIVIFPFLLMNMYLCWCDREKIRHWLKEVKPSLRRSIGVGMTLLLLAEGFFTWKRMREMTLTDMGSEMRAFLAVGTVLIMLGGFYWLLREKKWRNSFTWGIIILPMLVVNLGCAWYYIGRADTTEKQIMVQLDELVGEAYVLGGFPYGYCLYNDIIPASSVYDCYLEEDYIQRAKELLRQDEVQYYVGYRENDLLEAAAAETGYGFEVVKVFERSYDRRETDQIVLLKKVKTE